MKRNNILHILTDQQRADTLSDTFVRTPALDSLSNESTRFTQAYSPCPVCIPARTSMIYGRYPVNTGVSDNGKPLEIEEFDTVMQYLSQSGYRTHGIGKCHFYPDPAAMRGFQTRLISEEIVEAGVRDDYRDYLKDVGYEHAVEPLGLRSEMYYVPQPSVLPEQHHHSTWVADNAISFMEKEQANDQPWYLYAGFIQPHPPFTPPPQWEKLYRLLDIEDSSVPLNWQELVTHINRVQNRYKYRGNGWDDNLVKMIKAYYRACVSFVDYQVGRIIEGLKATGEYDNTLVLFSSDHGEMLGDLNCFGKRSMHDASAKVPLLVKFPRGQGAGRQIDQPVSLVDLAPTIVQSAELEPSNSWDGDSLYGYLDEGYNFERPVFSQFSEEGEGQYMVRVGGLKYYYSVADEKEFLFNLESDSQEIVNLAQELDWAGQKENLTRLLVAHLSSRGKQVVDADGKWLVLPFQPISEDPKEGLIRQDAETLSNVPIAYQA
ncbi:sulfatase family protein [Coraliomargarita sp. W4R72]